MSVMVTTPESDPFDFGVKVTLRMHRADGFTTPPLAHVVPLASLGTNSLQSMISDPFCVIASLADTFNQQTVTNRFDN